MTPPDNSIVISGEASTAVRRLFYGALGSGVLVGCFVVTTFVSSPIWFPIIRDWVSWQNADAVDGRAFRDSGDRFTKGDMDAERVRVDKSVDEKIEARMRVQAETNLEMKTRLEGIDARQRQTLIGMERLNANMDLVLKAIDK